MTDTWQQILELSDRDHTYMGGVDRSKERMQANGETFTPTTLVIEMMQLSLA